MHCLTRLCLAAAAPLHALSVNRLISQRLRSDASAVHDYDALLRSQLRRDYSLRCRCNRNTKSPKLRLRRRTPNSKSAVLTQTEVLHTPKSPATQSLATFYPQLSQTWLTAASSKMLQPHHLLPTSRKLAWWRCPHCTHDFTRRVDLHVASGGLCPSCKKKPSLCAASGDGFAPHRDSGLALGPKHTTAPLDKSSSSFSSSPFVSDRKSRVGRSATAMQRASSRTCRRHNASGATGPSPGTGTTTLGYHTEIVHRCRPDNSRVSLASVHTNYVRKSIADGRYLRVSEQRNFMPMLAKNYEKECEKIDEGEALWVSPKLDGVRCIAAYDCTKGAILFFSRSGTLFECCDANIEPALRCIFERDQTLVLDGELYNDSTNQVQLAGLSAPLRRHPLLCEIASSLPSSAARGRALSCDTDARANKSVHGTSREAEGKKTDKHTRDRPCISFDQLMSAVRTSREHRTPDVLKLQNNLQYHIFDVLYGAVSLHINNSGTTTTKREKEKSGDAGCTEKLLVRGKPTLSVGDLTYARRYAHLAAIVRHAHRHNMAHIDHYDPDVLRLVPAMACHKRDVAQALHAAMAAGYEGIMIRRSDRSGVTQRTVEDMTRLSHTAHDALIKSQTNVRCRAELLGTAGDRMKKDAPGKDRHAACGCTTACPTSSRLSARDQLGGYAYGERSSNLLKYKVMQDDEFIIVSAVQGNGKWTGCLGAFVCRAKNRQHQTFTVSPACTDEERRKMWSTWQSAYKGKALTVQYQSLTTDGIPRFPVGKCVRGTASGKDWV